MLQLSHNALDPYSLMDSKHFWPARGIFFELGQVLCNLLTLLLDVGDRLSATPEQHPAFVQANSSSSRTAHTGEDLRGDGISRQGL